MPGNGTGYADKAQAEIESRLRRIYSDAQKELTEKLNAHTKRLNAQDKVKRQQLADGQITQAQYNSWLRGQMFTGQQWKNKVDSLSETMLHANEQANAIVEGKRKAVFGKNVLYQSKRIQDDLHMGISFSAYDSASVTRLLRDQPELLPRRKVDKKKDKGWNQENISDAITQGIIQGDSIPEIAKRIATKTASKNEQAMVRYARTAMTGAQNAGRMEALHEAQDMGIKVKKVWLATLDSRTRHAHALLDGQTKDVDEPFESELGPIMYPGDLSANPANTWNCRCTLIYKYEGYGMQNATRYDQENGEEIENMTYSEWKNSKLAPTQILFDSFGLPIGEDVEMIDNNLQFITIKTSRQKDVNLPDGTEGGKSLGKSDMDVYTLPNGTKIYYKANLDTSKQDLNPADLIRTYYEIPEPYRQLMQKELHVVDYLNPNDDYWRKVYGGGFSRSYMNGGSSIDIWAYTNHDLDYMKKALIHEGGHYIDHHNNMISLSTEWREAIDKDTAFSGLISPTDYGKIDRSEDFADSCMKYVTDGEYMKKHFPNRTSILERVIGTI